MRTMMRAWLVTLLAILWTAALAQAQVAGTYHLQRKGLSGTLTVQELAGGEIAFKVHTVARATQHTAEIEGKVRLENDVGVYEGEEGCRLVLKFYPDLRKAVLSGGDETCRYYMGAAAAVDGAYVKK
ncbi:MAG: hypothetical protein FJ128_01140 [Deltaproteobacteria bacterium]|nr:hypothetical protein [Deltaproteobacteria bacterium]